MMKQVWILLSVTTGFLFATDIEGEYTGSQHWTTSGSPYQIIANASFTSGSNLEIDPGVEIEFTGDFTLSIGGILDAEGTATDSITFSSSSSTRQGTLSLAVTSTTLFSSLSYCSFEKMSVGIDLNNDFEPTHCSFDDCGTGVNLDNGGTISESLMENCDQGIYGTSSGNIVNCTITNSGRATDTNGKGIYLKDFDYTIDGCVVNDNRSYGIYVGDNYSGLGTLEIMDSHVFNNGDLGTYDGLRVNVTNSSINAYYNSTVNITNSEFRTNTGSGISVTGASGYSSRTHIVNSNISGSSIEGNGGDGLFMGSYSKLMSFE